MDTERTQATVNPEAWAAAQVEGVVKDLEKKRTRTKRIPPPKARGVFFRLNPNGQVKDHLGRMGDWWIRWTDTTGKEHREKCGSRPAAVDLYGKRRAEVRTGHHFPETMRKVRGTTLQDVCTDYTDTLKGNGRDPRGQVKTRLAEVVDILGSIAAKHLTPQDVEKLKARLLATPARGRKDPTDQKKERSRTPASVNRYCQDLRAAYNLARRNGKVDKNPVADVKLLRENNKRVREMTADEETAILTALDPTQRHTKAGRQDRRYRTDLRPLVPFLVETGLRAGEACNLRGRDIDWQAEVVTLPKTKAGKVQHVPLSAEAVAILRALGTSDRDGDAYVFAWPEGRPFTVEYLTHAFHKAAVKAGVTDLHIHDLRHTAACRWLRAGVDIYTVSKLLRHASVVMSERYNHLSQADLKAAVDRKKASSDATR